MLERQNLYLTLPWISPHLKIKFFWVAAGNFHTVNDQQVGQLRTLLKSISNGILVHRAVNETKTK